MPAQTPLFRFGEGLSLTTFNISCSPAMMQDMMQLPNQRNQRMEAFRGGGP